MESCPRRSFACRVKEKHFLNGKAETENGGGPGVDDHPQECVRTGGDALGGGEANDRVRVSQTEHSQL
jgi:hypothetical protein